MNQVFLWLGNKPLTFVHWRDPARLKYVIRRMQETIENQTEEIRALTHENRMLDARDSRHVNAAMEALEALGEARQLDPSRKVDPIKLLCETARNLKVGAPA